MQDKKTELSMLMFRLMGFRQSVIRHNGLSTTLQFDARISTSGAHTLHSYDRFPTQMKDPTQSLRDLQKRTRCRRYFF